MIEIHAWWNNFIILQPSSVADYLPEIHRGQEHSTYIPLETFHYEIASPKKSTSGGGHDFHVFLCQKPMREENKQSYTCRSIGVI